MEPDEREPRDSSDADEASASEPTQSEGPDRRVPDEPAADEPDPTWEPAPVDSPAAAEIESWPSQDATGGSASSAQQPETAPPAWPTEPPAAGSADADAWPTTPPERGEQPVLTPEWGATPEPNWSDERQAEAARDYAATEPPPSEVEAYPAAPASDADVPPPDGAAAAGAAHVVPAAESATGESTQCPRCGTENRPGLAFCRNCGQRLVAAGVASTVERPGTSEGTMACPRCGTHNRAGVAFCQNCGANLRGAAPGYVPPVVAAEPSAEAGAVARRGAVLGPVVLLIGLVGLVTGYLLPFLYGSGSLFERAMGADGYGIAFWAGYPEVGAALADQAYFGLAGPVPLLALLLLLLAVAGFVRARPGPLQAAGLAIALLWSVGLIVLFAVVELAGNWSGDLVGMLRVLTPAGIIFFLASLIVLIGTLTRFGRS